MALLQERQTQALARALERFFVTLAGRAARRFLELSKDVSPSDIITSGDERELERIMLAHLTSTIEDQSDLVAELIDIDPLREGMPGMELLRSEVAQRIVRINAQTRLAVQDTLRDGLARGYTATQIANGVPDDGFRGIRAVVRQTYANRHETIARTEVGHIAQRTSEDRYRAGGVREVDISDGPDCGWTEHDDPDLADGSRRTLEELHANPLSHPNCVRVPLPVVEL